MFYVSEYTTTREYGGPEEGGWWFQWNDFVGQASGWQNEEDAYAEARRLNGYAKETGQYDRVNYGGTVYKVEETLGESQTTRRPHYE